MYLFFFFFLFFSFFLFSKWKCGRIMDVGVDVDVGSQFGEGQT